MARYEVWCRAHLEARPFNGPSPRYVTSTLKEARELKRQADLECQSKAMHFVKRVEEPVLTYAQIKALRRMAIGQDLSVSGVTMSRLVRRGLARPHAVLPGRFSLTPSGAGWLDAHPTLKVPCG